MFRQYRNIVMFFSFAIILCYLPENNNMVSGITSDNVEPTDHFGIREIYPTVPGGREWFINMDNPRSDGLFYITSDKNITRQHDSSWLANSTEVRMNVDTPMGSKPWKNVEITGYAKILSVIN